MATQRERSEASEKGKQQSAFMQLTPAALAAELADINRKIAAGAKLLSELNEDEIAISTTPKDEIYRDDMIVLYRYRPLVEQPLKIPVLLSYALVGRYMMIDLEEERSFVRKLLSAGIDLYVVDWGEPTRAHRWLNIDDYVNGYLDACVDVIRQRTAMDKINLLGVCQGGVFSLCYAALHPDKVNNLILTVTPVDFRADEGERTLGAGYVNLWARNAREEDIDLLIDTCGSLTGPAMGFSFLMMNPISNIAKYTSELVAMLDSKPKLISFLKMERWIADRPDHPGEVLRQWLRDFYRDNKLIKNEIVLGGKRVDLQNVTMPVLNIYASGDAIVPPACSKGLTGRCGSSDYTILEVPGGHIGTFVGAKAQSILAPAIIDWLKARTATPAKVTKPATRAARKRAA